MNNEQTKYIIGLLDSVYSEVMSKGGEDYSDVLSLIDELQNSIEEKGGII
jgi:hypothetical protein